VSARAPDPDADEAVPTTARERTVWASLVAVVISSGAYLLLIVARLFTRPAAAIPWVAPMLWTMGLGVVGAIVLSIVFTVVARARQGDRCSPAARGDVVSDVRDREIGRLGGRAALGTISTGAAGALVLTMLEVAPFWIGNLLFLCGTTTAVVEAVAQIRLYRRGFP
jgi:hypothetical protein